MGLSKNKGNKSYQKHWLGVYMLGITSFEEVLRIQPKNYDVCKLLGMRYEYIGKKDKAIDFFKKSIQIKPTYKAYSELGKT